ncbi:MAG: hypothetical protein IKO19_07775 [Candidatus Riflebacteria bacterium]|nr:hypothetical protein [Candidatus Riflebacteria bacterium]MBR4570544.1 hypothetical protein [Candidatus Riflebacteria bacterium]
MGNGNIEIILIELAGASVKNKLSWRHSISRSAPLGLYCLKAIAQERIALIDVPVPQINDMLTVYKSSPVKTVICRLAEEPDNEEVKSLADSIHEIFPNARLGCNFVKSDITKVFNFVIYGTGKSSILRILRGDELNGYCDQFENDKNAPLDIPDEPLIDVGYNVLPEKWLSVHNLEIWQPWQGLLEFSTSLFTYPGTDWMTNLLVWLTKSGFDAFHFTPSDWTVDEMNHLRAFFQKHNLQLSLSFLSDKEVHYSDILLPVKRLWLYDPQAVKAEEVINKLKEIRNAGFEACLQINHGWFGGGVTLPVCKYIDHLIIRDDYLWSNAEHKRLMQRFWGTKNRFFRRLFGLRTASELITFMRTSYALLDLLFLPEEKGDK